MTGHKRRRVTEAGQLTRDLGGRRSENGDEGSRVDDASLAAAGVLAHRIDRVLAAPPDSLDVTARSSQGNLEISTVALELEGPGADDRIHCNIDERSVWITRKVRVKSLP